ncbi:MAG: hypothetical protein JRI97_10385 [Deltaproteobacteria bacterium]|nr:hypothetical protein [Deltaproteobacteria bacterium]
MATNADIVAVKAGEQGKALSTLAALVMDLSRESAALAARMEQSVGRLAGWAKKAGGAGLASAFGREMARSGAGSAQGQIQELASTHARFQQFSTDALGKVERLKSIVDRTKRLLDFLLGLAAGVSEAVGELEELLALSDSMAGCGEEDREILDRAETRYTVGQEFVVHDKVVNGEQDQGLEIFGESAEADDAQADEADELGDNVELF